MTQATLPISSITRDPEVQPREKLDDEVVKEYADCMLAGILFTAVVVYYDRTIHWLAEGFHRVAAALLAGRDTITAEIRTGGRREAILHAVGSNGVHGLRRTNQDKRRAVVKLLRDEVWSRWSNEEIARRCHVTAAYVGKLKPGSGSDPSLNSLETRSFIRAGKKHQMRVSGIGRRRAKSDGKASAPSLDPADKQGPSKENPAAQPEGQIPPRQATTNNYQQPLQKREPHEAPSGQKQDPEKA